MTEKKTSTVEMNEDGSISSASSQAETKQTTEGLEEKSLEVLCHALEQENADLKERLLRAFSDQENQKKRFEHELQRMSRKTLGQFASEIFPIIDNFERALASASGLTAQDSQCDASHFNRIQNVMQGIQLIHKEMLSVLQRFGIHKLDSLGHFFDPECHQAMGHVVHETYDAGVVAQVLQEGYKMVHDKNHTVILRPASVLLAQKLETESVSDATSPVAS